MSKTTRATQALEKLGVKFSLHTYDYDPDADSIGLQAAEALGVAPARMLKTLMAEADGKAVCAVVPSDREVSMKKLAAAFGAKAARMMRPPDAERLTGYHVGGISPFGQKSACPSRSRKPRLRTRAYSSMAGSAACRSSSIPTMR
jgi:Cys-tRNA(Pro)/Cys-tRNA(Cys) deacylase